MLLERAVHVMKLQITRHFIFIQNKTAIQRPVCLSRLCIFVSEQRIQLCCCHVETQLRRRKTCPVQKNQRGKLPCLKHSITTFDASVARLETDIPDQCTFNLYKHVLLQLYLVVKRETVMQIFSEESRTRRLWNYFLRSLLL